MVINVRTSTTSQEEIEAQQLVFKKHLKLIIFSALSFTSFIVILLVYLQIGGIAGLSVLSLILFNFGEFIYYAYRILCYSSPEREELQELFESLLMLLFKIGIIVKMVFKEIDCAFLILPVALSILSRFLISQELIQEIRGVFPIIRTILRFFILLMTFTVTMKIQGYLEISWGQVLWPYWVIFAILIFLSFGSVVIAWNTFCCSIGGQRTTSNEIIASIWFCFFFCGLCVFSFFIAYEFNNCIENNPKEIRVSLILCGLFLIVLVIYTSLCINILSSFWIKLIALHNSHPQTLIQVNMIRYIPNDNAVIREDDQTTEQIYRTLPPVLFRVAPESSMMMFKESNNQNIPVESKLESSIIGSKTERAPQEEFQSSRACLTEWGKKQDISKICFNKNQQGSSPESTKCIICMERNANAVFYPCCHGGICFECGKELINHKAACVFCRRNFWQLLRVESTDNNNYRIIEISQVFKKPQILEEVKLQELKLLIPMADEPGPKVAHGRPQHGLFLQRYAEQSGIGLGCVRHGLPISLAESSGTLPSVGQTALEPAYEVDGPPDGPGEAAGI